MDGYWNEIGGKIEADETPLEAMQREFQEETGYVECDFEHRVTFTCPGGTIFIYAAICTAENVSYKQIENERLKRWQLTHLPVLMMENLKWIIPLCLADIKFPVMIHQNGYGVKGKIS